MTTKKNNGLPILIVVTVVFLLLEQLPFGSLILWPLSVLTTFVHEMGHGLSALFSGGRLNSIEIYSSGGGLARTVTYTDWQLALVAACGLIAPTLTGGIFITAGINPIIASRALLIFSIFILICCAVWVRTFYGLLIMLPLGAGFLIVSIKGSATVKHFLLQFLGVHMSVSTFNRTIPYLFSTTAKVGGGEYHSDTALIAASVGGGYILWAAIIGLFCIVIFILSIKRTYLH